MGEARRRREAGLPPRRAPSVVLDGGYTIVCMKDGTVRLDGLCPGCDEEHWLWRGELVEVLSVLAELGASVEAISGAATLVAAAFASDGPAPADAVH